jgi:thymidylate synthase ThyX
MKKFTDEERKILGRHISNVEGDVYVIRNLPPEVVAVLFAYVSRSPLSFKENLLKLIKSKDLDMGNLINIYYSKGLDYSEAKKRAREFHEKWVVGYGHSSVAEHAVASIAIENLSILATKIIEDNRLVSFTEKSTRYQVFERNHYYKPKRLMDSRFRKEYESVCKHLFHVYLELFPKTLEYVKKLNPKPKEMCEKSYESLSKAKACDILRYVLPTSTLTNLGMTANARNLEYMITKLLSNPLDEARELGKKIKQEVLKVIPTLVKYANRNPYIAETNKAMEGLIPKLLDSKEIETSKPVVLVGYDPEAENKLITAIIYRYSHLPYNQIKNQVKNFDRSKKERIFDEFLKRMGPHDQPLRELEHVYYTFDITIDYGAFRDIQRHRMCTQTNQILNTKEGYDIPKEIIDMGFEKKFQECMERAKQAFEKISKSFPLEAQYVLPLAFRKRTLFTWNLRELYHFIKLRIRKEGHPSYRRIAKEIYKELQNVHPLLAKYIQITNE